MLNDSGRIVSTREPNPRPGPRFVLVRSSNSCVWGVRADVPDEVASKIDGLAREEPPVADLRDAPLHAERYRSIVENATAPVRVEAGPAFDFPDSLVQSEGIVVIEDERLLDHNFRGWVSGEIKAGSGPVMAIVKNGHPVSICFSARSSEVAAEAGVETTESFRGKGFAPLVTAAWAIAIRKSGKRPLYSTSWTNHASLAVAGKLNLVAYASSWSLSD